MDSMYASFLVSRRVLQELALRVPHLLEREDKLSGIDFGAGAGAAGFAMREVFGEKMERIAFVETSPRMTIVGRALTHSLGSGVRWSPTVSSSLVEEDSVDVATCAFVLGEVAEGNREGVVLELWRKVRPGGYLVMIEPGDAQGHKRVARAREFILGIAPPSSSDYSAAFTVAPCGHDLPCPLIRLQEKYRADAINKREERKARKELGKTKTMKKDQKKQERGTFKKMECAYPLSVIVSQFPKKSILKEKLNTPLPIGKYAGQHLLKYSYVIMGKGHSPRLVQSTLEEFPEYKFDRLVRPSLKRKQHIIVDICSHKGIMQRSVFARGTSKSEPGTREQYKIARDLSWGDLLPSSHWDQFHRDGHAPGIDGDSVDDLEDQRDSQPEDFVDADEYPAAVGEPSEEEGQELIASELTESELNELNASESKDT
jgi:ribosomal protein RSM22 (predicted rRNA methylase)